MKKILFLTLFFGLFACKKAEERSCFKSSGEKTSLHVSLPDFDKLVLNKKLDYTLVQDDSTYLEISGGKNLLNFVEWKETEAGKIEISNSNKCNFLRDLSAKISVEVHFKNLSEIRFMGSEMLRNKDSLKFDNLYLLVVDCSGSVDITVDAKFLKCEVSDGYGDYTLHGKIENADFGLRANGYANCQDVQISSSLKVVNKSVGDIYVNANNCNLSGYIAGSGNVYYKGNPITKQIELLNSGKLIAY